MLLERTVGLAREAMRRASSVMRAVTRASVDVQLSAEWHMSVSRHKCYACPLSEDAEVCHQWMNTRTWGRA